ncbi:hypothetical conserved protein [Oceanobacillus iheyensis HTE831]|uniref:Hypothetical conserved protein n=1 Tax=Oceanobacillus iheyensis (strain DSM 14371 / CIP 107618 / JCM 11309 / KCTC 3954 / HTE831) TaxID=221109 RepID=Q8EPK7_OCEIH|nr:NAD(P)-dependent oxidoreductase [Oceanobacillus iheyensis]BAC14050.1 hypothetical conserved protein [Oceanobacillus iheyensis HTE831]
MRKVVLIGGSGTIGTILQRGLKQEFDVYSLDVNVDENSANSKETDAKNFTELINNIPNGTDVLINLLSTGNVGRLVNISEMNDMVDVYFKASYNILKAAEELNIPKVVFASSNHVTDYYESEGKSKLGRSINVNDYPYSEGLYGVLKLAVENIGFAFSNQYGISVINLRIGSVKLNEETEIYKNLKRNRHTWLSEVDTITLFKEAIISDIGYGTFYGVSDNPNKPWCNDNAKEKLGFVSKMNSNDIIKNK